MRLVAGIRFAVLHVGLAQVVYLVGFSYAFFWVGKTGLIIAIGAVATLFVLMQATGRLNWHAIFNPPSEQPEPPMPPACFPVSRGGDPVAARSATLTKLTSPAGRVIRSNP